MALLPHLVDLIPHIHFYLNKISRTQFRSLILSEPSPSPQPTPHKLVLRDNRNQCSRRRKTCPGNTCCCHSEPTERDESCLCGLCGLCGNLSKWPRRRRRARHGRKVAFGAM